MFVARLCAEVPEAVTPLVSVLMPTHDYARFVPESIASLQAQTYECWECLIIDDGSTDDTQAIVSKLAQHDRRIRYQRQEQSGPAIARNRALEASCGKYIQFLDADDLIPSWKLTAHVEALEANGDVDLVYGPTKYFDQGELTGFLREAIHEPDASEPPRVDGRGRSVIDILLERNVITIEAPLTRKSVFDELGGFQEQLRRITDWEFWLRCAIAGKRFAYLPTDEPVALIRVHSASLSYDAVVMRLVEIEMRRSLADSLPSGPSRARNRQLLTEVAADTGIALGLRGEVARGLRLLAPAAVSQRRLSWLMWSLALLATPLPFVRRRLRTRRYGRQDGSAAA